MTDLAFGQPDDGIIQMAYTVADLGQAMAQFTADLGAGPWFVFRQLSGPNPQYRGTPSQAACDIALGYAGHMQIELIQPKDDHPSVYLETIMQRGHGFHHFGVAATDFALACDRLAAKTYDLAFSDEVVGVTRVAYFDTRGLLPGMIEVIEATPQLESLFLMMHEAAVGWDGTNPVREMAGENTQ
ncbi:VOC family protein [Alteraurantiacibacter buctensis]|uniref:VOC family protein n=1 Tax=Alteraurantiacibacter buctensis TaxID=1503981 RepID=A0A844Z2V9_9SPHN|nr:VOC family protein [Alteraurantiacibacter buctensis]MXO73024.1 VOC family protein [Alteraurantiacibacter buctensis]